MDPSYTIVFYCQLMPLSCLRGGGLDAEEAEEVFYPACGSKTCEQLTVVIVGINDLNGFGIPKDKNSPVFLANAEAPDV